MYGVFNGGGGIFSGIGTSSVTALVEGFNRAVAPDLVVASQSSIIKGQIQEGVDSSILGHPDAYTINCIAHYDHDYVDLCDANRRHQRRHGKRRKNP